MKPMLALVSILVMATAAEAQTRLALQTVPAKVFVHVVGLEDEFEGVLIARDADSVTFNVQSRTYTFPLSRVIKIEVQGRRRTGIGAVSGALIGGLAGALCFYCAQGLNQRDSPNFALTYGVQGALIGGFIGFFRHDRHQIYPEPAPKQVSEPSPTSKTAPSRSSRRLKGAILGVSAGALLGAAPWSQEACSQRRWCVVKAGGLFGVAGLAMTWK